MAPTTKLHVVTPATHTEGYLNSLMQSCILLGIQLTVLGWGEKWGGFAKKWMHVYNYCKKLPPNDVILIIDAFDCIITQPSNVILERFLSFNTPIIVGAEACGRWGPLTSIFEGGHISLFDEDMSDNFPVPKLGSPKDIGLRFLNSGTMIGRVHTIQELLAKMPPHLDNDQVYFTSLYIKDPNQDILIDTTCTLFHVWRSDSNVELLSHQAAAKEYPFYRPYYINENGEKVNMGKYNQMFEPANTQEEFYSEWVNKLGIWDRNFGDICPTQMKYSVADKETGMVPCVLHIHCRRNKDWLMKKLGIIPFYGSRFHFFWYFYYSLSSDLKRPNFRRVFFSILVCVTGLIATLLCAIATVIHLMGYLPVALWTILVFDACSVFTAIIGFAALHYFTVTKRYMMKKKDEGVRIGEKVSINDVSN